MSQVFKDVGNFVSKELSEDKKRLIITFQPISGKLAGKDVVRANFVSALDSEVIKTVKSLKEGDPITLDIIIKKVGGNTHRNFIAVRNGHEQTVTSSKKTGGDYNDRAAKGQALNLAMQIAIAEGKQHDTDYILSLVPTMISLGETVQGDKTTTAKTASSTATTTTTKTTGTTATKFKKEEEPNPWDDVEYDELDDLLEL